MTTGSDPKVTGTNTSGLYGSTGQVTVGTAQYGNANVAAFLATYTGNLTAGNASVSGNITGGNILSDNYFYANGQPISFAGTYSNANVAAYLPIYSGNIAAGNGNITNDLFVGGTIYGTFSGNIAGNLVVPGANTEILYNNAGNAGASSDFRFDSATRVMLLNGTANVANIIVPQQGTIDVGNSRIQNVQTPSAGQDAVNKDYVDSTASSVGWVLEDQFNVPTGVQDGDGVQFIGTNNQIETNVVATRTLEISLANTISVAGNITGNYILGNGSQLTGLPATYGNANVATFLADFGANAISTTGNVTAGYFIGNGSLLTGLSGTYSNANVAAFLAAFGSNTISTSGNITSGNIIADGQFLTNLPGANVTGTVANATYALNANAATFAGTVTTNAQPNITSVGTLSSLSSTGNITGGNILTPGAVSATGNITGLYIIGDGSLLTNINAGNIVGSYGNANVANFLANFGSNNITTTGNITAGYFAGNGSALTDITGANVTGTVANATYALNANAATLAGTVTTNAQPNITSVGNLTSLTVSGDSLMLGNLQVNGNVTYIASNTVTINDKFINVANNAANSSQATGGGIGVGPAGSEYATWTFSDANTAWQSNIKIEAPAVSATGNITGNYIIGDGSLLTNINAGNIVGSYSNANVANYLPTFGGNVGAGNVVLTTNTGRVYVNEIQGLSGAGLSITADGTEDINLNADTIRVGDNNTDATLTTHGTGDLILTTHQGSAAEGNIIIRDGASGNIDIQTNGSGVVNITGSAGLRVTDGVSAAGNITGANIIGNGQFLTNLPGANVTGTVANAAYALSANSATFAGTVTTNAQPNITSVGTLTSLTSSGNVTGGNLLTGGVVSATGNITGNYFFGNGAFLTGISASVAGSNTQVQFNDAGVFGASANLTFNKATQELQTDRINLVGGNVNFDPPSGTAGPRYITLTTDSGQPFYGVRIGPGATAANIPGAARDTVAIGRNAGNDNQGDNSIAIGLAAGNLNSGAYTVAIGTAAGANTQGSSAIAIGDEAGRENQGPSAIAIGEDAGYTSQGARSIAIGPLAGNVSQGNTAIAIGYGAGQNNQPANSIVINANGTTALNATNSGFYVMPVRNDTGNTTNAVYYNTTTKELTYTTSGSGGYGDANVATFLAVYGSNTFSSTGNVTTTGVFTASNTTANLQVANIIFNNQQLQTVAARNPAAISATVADPGRIVIGTGYGGNLSPGNDLNNYFRGARLAVGDSISQADNQQRTVAVAAQQFVTATANITNNNTRMIATSGQLMLGGGSSGNTFGQTNPLTINGGAFSVLVGGGTSGNLTAMGNTITTVATGTSAGVIANPGGTIRSGINFLAFNNGSNGSGNIGNAIAFTWQTLSSTGSGNTSCYTGNVYMIYNAGSTNDFGWTQATAARSAPNYYFLRNDDNAAQNKMGAMRLWHNYRYDHTTTTGAITIDKNNGQTQYIAVTGNITGITLSNFVTTASDGTNTDQEMDTVTLWLRQDATGRTITMPTGANYFYANGTTTVSTTANSVSKIEFTAIDNSGTQYLIDISQAYTST